MTIKIYKGTNEIGGSCIELKTKNTTILLDYGTPLQDTSEQVKIIDNIDAILISHPHQDHFGEIVNIENSTPIYCGELSVELMNAAKIFTGNEILENNFQIFEAWKSFEIGDFKITPYLVDHSATDAYAFLIEADGKKVLYSGDFRANGRKSKLFDNIINEKKLKDVDVLLMEGTMIQRSNKDFPDEQSVEDKMFQIIKENNQITFMIGSSQNIDSIVSAYRACKRAKKIFVVDMYTAWILEKLKLVSNSIPNMSWSDVKVIKKFGGSYYQKLQENKEYFKGYTSKLFNNIVEIEEIKNNPQDYFLKVSPWHIQKVLDITELKSSNIIYSQWLGYLESEFSDEKTVALFKTLHENNNWVYAHTSGHADLPALQKFAHAINPKKLIPIHTEYKKKFTEYFENVLVLEDNDIYSLDTNFITKTILFEDVYSDFYNELKIVDLVDFKAKEVDTTVKELEYSAKIEGDKLILIYDEYENVVVSEQFVNMSIDNIEVILGESIEYEQSYTSDITPDMIGETNRLEECIEEGVDCSYVKSYRFSLGVKVTLKG